MGKSSRRKRQSGARPGAQHAMQPRRRPRGGHAEDLAASTLHLLDPQLSPAEVAGHVAAEFADWAGAGTIARMRLGNGVPLREVSEASRLLRASAAGPPGLGVLSFAASVAHAEGDEQAEHGYTAQMLAHTKAAGDDKLRLEVARFISSTGHPGEAIELAEPYLREHLDDQDAAFNYSLMVQEAAGLAEPGDRDRAALVRFADRSGLAEVKGAVVAFLGRTRWGELVQNRAANDLSLVPGHLPPAVLKECAALAFEAAVKGAEDGIEGMTVRQLIDLYRGGHQPKTALTGFAEDQESSPTLARRAADWAKHAHYGLWQLAYPSAAPGVWGTDLASGTRKYIQFPPGALDGAPRWTVWLGGVVPVEGVWRATGTGITLSPAEADAAAEAIDKAVGKVLMTTAGMPLAEMLPPEPIPYGEAPPWGVRWDHFKPRDPSYTLAASNAVMMLAARIVADVMIHRAGPSPDAGDGVPPLTDAWLDERLLALHGFTPREAAQADTPYVMLLESLLRQFEYQADPGAASGRESADVARLRAELAMGGD